MSHTLHREGSVESLSKDYVVLAMPCQGRTIEGSGEKLRKFMQMAMPYHPVNFGNSKVGNSINLAGGFDELIEKTVDGHICHVVFNDVNDLYHFICDVKQADMGISIVVSGLMDVVGECCHKAGICFQIIRGFLIPIHSTLIFRYAIFCVKYMQIHRIPFYFTPILKQDYFRYLHQRS